MKVLSRALLVVVAALALAFAIINRQSVELDLGAWVVTVRLYLLLIATLALGVVIGGLVGWFGGAPRRRQARTEARRARALEERVAALERDRASGAAPGGALPPPRLPPHMDED